MDSLIDISRSFEPDEDERPYSDAPIPSRRPRSSLHSGMTARTKPHQATFAQSISCVGRGLHTGLDIRLTLRPAPANHGIVFLRTDRPGSHPIPARFDHVVDTRLSTVIAEPSDPMIRVATIEHLMAALHGCRIHNALIEVSGPELPVLDGSSSDYLFLLNCAGRTESLAPVRTAEILKKIRVTGEDGAFAELRPARRGLSLSMSIDFPAAIIGRQTYALKLSEDRFRQDLANCRTFVLRRDIEALQKAGLALGGSLDNAIVVDGDHVLNPAGLRHSDEFVRHKLLDAVGDLYLADMTLNAEFIGHKSGHNLNNRLLHAVFSDAANWRMTENTTPHTAVAA